MPVNQLLRPITIYKGLDGLRRVMLLSSNAYEDRDEEIVMEKALKAHVENFSSGPILFWHGGQPIGKAINAEMHGPFLLELGKELPNKIIDLAKAGEEPFLIERKHVWDMLEKRKGKWGVSIGFGSLVDRDDFDGVYDNVHIIERSILPRKYAANLLTYAAL